MTADAAVLRPDIKHVELLFEPMRLGRMTLPHRIAMAPLTRSRARQPGNVPKPLNASYYVQRASAACKVMSLLPYEGRGMLLYRVRSDAESFERIVAEGDLSRD